jgi:hypothetical protein
LILTRVSWPACSHPVVAPKLNIPRIDLNQDGELDLPNKMYGTVLKSAFQITASQQSIKPKQWAIQ